MPVWRTRWLLAVMIGAAFSAFGTSACDVPAVEFASDDAGADALSTSLLSGDTPDTGSIPDIDASALDAADEATKADAAPDAATQAAPDASPSRDAEPQDAQPAEDAAPGLTCPGFVPAGAASCCNEVPCVAANAKKCAKACATCEQSCAGSTCCLAPNGTFAGCRSSPFECGSPAKMQ